jgi:hypothetical protein
MRPEARKFPKRAPTNVNMTRRLLIIVAALVALLVAPSAALAKRGDRNHDRIPDKWERHFHLSLKQNQAKRDPDHDGLSNKQEFKDHTNPRAADTDSDGVDDGDEVANGDDPTDPSSGGADDSTADQPGDASGPDTGDDPVDATQDDGSAADTATAPAGSDSADSADSSSD